MSAKYGTHLKTKQGKSIENVQGGHSSFNLQLGTAVGDKEREGGQRNRGEDKEKTKEMSWRGPPRGGQCWTRPVGRKYSFTIFAENINWTDSEIISR